MALLSDALKDTYSNLNILVTIYNTWVITCYNMS